MTHFQATYVDRFQQSSRGKEGADQDVAPGRIPGLPGYTVMTLR